MIDLGNSVRHAMIIGIFSLEREGVVLANDRGERTVSPRISHVRSNASKLPGSITDQAKTKIVVLCDRLRRSEESSDEISVKIWRAHGQLGLLQCKKAMMVPWSLAKGREGQRVNIRNPGVSLARSSEMWVEIRH